MAEIALIVFNVAIIAVFAFFQYLNHKERKDLYDRLMSRSFVEYKDNLIPEENNFKDDSDKYIDLEIAREQIEES